MEQLCNSMNRMTVSHDYMIKSNLNSVSMTIYTEDLQQLMIIYKEISSKTKEEAILYLQEYILRLPVFSYNDLDITDSSSLNLVFDMILSRDIKNDIRSLFIQNNFSDSFLTNIISEWYISILKVRKTNKMKHHWCR